MSDRYHLRRVEKAIGSRDEMLDIIDSVPYMTIAMCKDRSPYLVTVNHVLDRERVCLYFHAASEGRKVDYMRSNPDVWGQVVEDLGYVDGECDWAYRTVHFWGGAAFVTDEAEKRRALELLVDKLETVAKAKAGHFTDSGLSKVLICRISLRGLTGKQRLRGSR